MRLRLAHRARRRSRRDDDRHLLDALLAIVDVPVFACAADGTLSHANRDARELLGVAECQPGASLELLVEALGPRTPSGIALPREDLPPVRALEGETVDGVDMLVRLDGKDMLLEARARPVTDGKGRRCGAVVAVEDVTERRRQEAQQRRALRSIDADPPEN